MSAQIYTSHFSVEHLYSELCNYYVTTETRRIYNAICRLTYIPFFVLLFAFSIIEAGKPWEHLPCDFGTQGGSMGGQCLTIQIRNLRVSFLLVKPSSTDEHLGSCLVIEHSMMKSSTV